MAVVLDPGVGPPSHRADSLPLPLVLTAGRQVRRLSVADFPSPVTPVGQVRIPSWFSARSAKHRRDLAATLRNATAGRELARPAPAPAPPEEAAAQAGIARLRAQVRAHPCHGCPDAGEHARRAEERARLAREVGRLEAAVAGRSHVIARTFGRVCTVLEQLGYLDADTVTPDGSRLADLYTELDLLAAECLRRGLWDGLSPAELAACASALTYESRNPEADGAARLPGGRPRAVLAAMVSVWAELDALEKQNRLSFLRAPDLRFAWTAHAWAEGKPLGSVLDPDLTPGDFVRAAKQLIDLLGQIAVAAGRDSGLSATARAAAAALRRGVVAYSAVGEDAEAEDPLAAAEEP
jgi:ATP-dependent RNA helicase HelY